MTKADRKSQKIADDAERQQAAKAERSKLSKTIKQIANSIDESLGTPAERKIMACKALAAEHDLSVTEWCKEAGITRPTWYNALHRPGFGDRCCDVAKTVFGPYAIEIAGAMVKKARFGSQDGMGDVTAQTKILQQVEVVDKEDAGIRTYTDHELRVIAREALGIITGEKGDGDTVQPGVASEAS